MTKEFVAARDVAALVPMPDLLNTLGIQVNTRSRRAPCLLHGGTNISAFCWRDNGVWFCFSCGKGGDKFTLVQEIRKCNFLEALRFLAAMAGIKFADLDTTEARRQLAKAKRKDQRVKAACMKLQSLERDLLLTARDEVFSLRKLRRDAGARLTAIREGEKPRFTDEEAVAWDALALVARQELTASARYTFLAFASPADRADFALNPRERKRMVEEALAAGAVIDEKGRVMEIIT
jgi:hypothetical protein